MIRHTLERFSKPTWTAPFHWSAELGDIPADDVISGMFPNALVEAAKRRRIQLPSARPRYISFSFYPLREHAQLLREATELLYPDQPVRVALRRLGQYAPRVLLNSSLGKVVLGSATSVHQSINAMARAYPLNVRSCRAQVVETSDRHAVVQLSQLHYFIDSHHIGAFEGVLAHAGVQGEVLINVLEPGNAELLLRW